MKTVHTTRETPRARLLRLARESLVRPRELQGPDYLKLVGLLLLFSTIVGVAFIGGSSAAEIMRAYADEIRRFATQLWQ